MVTLTKVPAVPEAWNFAWDIFLPSLNHDKIGESQCRSLGRFMGRHSHAQIAMEDVTCLVCFEDATNARSRACPNCGKMFCYACLTRCPTESRMTTTPCPHCRFARPVQNYLKLNFVDNLRRELAEKDKAMRDVSQLKSDVLKLQSQAAAYDEKFEQVIVLVGV